MACLASTHFCPSIISLGLLECLQLTILLWWPIGSIDTGCCKVTLSPEGLLMVFAVLTNSRSGFVAANPVNFCRFFAIRSFCLRMPLSWAVYWQNQGHQPRSWLLAILWLCPGYQPNKIASFADMIMMGSTSKQWQKLYYYGSLERCPMMRAVVSNVVNKTSQFLECRLPTFWSSNMMVCALYCISVIIQDRI